MNDILLRATALGKRFGGFIALDNVDFEVRQGERVGLIGPNGSGKSTFVSCLAGEFPNHTGKVIFAGEPLDGLSTHERVQRGLSRTFQLPRPFLSLSVRDNVRAPLMFSKRSRSGSVDDQVAAGLDLVGLSDKADDFPASLTQVDLRKLELARALVGRPRLLIADKSMAGLSNSELDQILALLFKVSASGSAVIMIEHIMRAVTAFSQRLAVFVAGRKVADGEPREVLALPQVEAAYLGE